VHEILQPLGITEQILKNWLFSKAGYVLPPGQFDPADVAKLELPLFSKLKYLRVDTF
jgi:hypothetical protein